MAKADIKLILSSLWQKTGSLFVNIGRWLWRWSHWQRGLPIASLIIIGLGLFVFLKLEVINFPNIYYLLSAISQGLAVILAIILSATLVAGQLASRYSPELLKEAFKHPTLFYVALLIVSVALPLAILANTDIAFSVMWMKFSLTLAGACLTFLIPYFLYIKEQLDPKKLIDSLYNECLRNYTKGRPMKKDDIIQETVLSLYNTKSYGGFEHGLQKLTQLVKDVTPPLRKSKRRDEDEEEKRQEESTERILLLLVIDKLIGRVRDIGISVQDDPRATSMVIKALGDCALTVEDRDINNLITEGLREGVSGVIELAREATCESIAYDLGGIGGKAAARGQRIATKGLLEVLETMCFWALDKKRDTVARQVIISIHSVGGIAIDNEPENVSKGASLSREAIIRLYQSFNTAIGKERDGPAGEAAWRLRDLGWKAIEKGLKPPIEEAISGVGKVAQKTIELRKELPTKEAIEALVGYGDEVVKKFPDEMATRCLKWLTTVGSKVFDDYEELAQKVIEGLGTIGEQAAKQAEPKLEVVEEVISSLSSLTEKINGAKPRLASSIAAQLWGIGGYAVQQASIKGALNNLKEKAGEQALESGFRYVELHWDPCPEGLSGFKEYYNTDC